MKNILITGFIFCCLASCSEDFLEIAPKSEANATNFFKNTNDFNTALIGAYATLQDQVGDLYFEMTGYRSDNMQLDAPTAGTQDRYNIDVFQETSANGIILDVWGLLYNGIAQSNEIIAQLEAVEIDSDLEAQYAGEARFLRALNYFNLIRFWGDVPLVLQPLSPKNALEVGRTPIDEIYRAIEDDLLFATSNLPEAYIDSEQGRATSGAAKSLLGKVYLTQQKYVEAKDILEQVINSNQYQLLDNVSSVFDVNNKGNEEIIFAIRYNKEVIGESHGQWFTVPDPTTSSVVSASLVNAYAEDDLRKTLVEFSQVGSAFSLNKFFDELSQTTNGTGNDYIVIRFADILLMYAEALNEIAYENDGQAFELLNRIRSRAGVEELTSTTIPDKGSFREAVLKERRLELPLEGQRWFDLIRTGKARPAIQEVGITIQDYQLLYPIPQTEIEKINDPSIFAQNDGY